MSTAANAIADLIDAGAQSILKSDEDLSHEQAVDRFLTTEVGRKLYAAHSSVMSSAHPCYVTGTAPTGIAKSNGSAWEKILAGAKALVEKSDEELSEPQAIDSFLKTAEGKALYAEYVSPPKAVDEPARRAPVRKTALAMTDVQKEFLDDMKRGPVRKDAAQTRDSVAAAALQASSAWAEIEAEARTIVMKDAQLDLEDSIDRVLERRPDLAARYASAYAVQVAQQVAA